MTEMLGLYHQEAIRIWETFCTLHQELYELTCDEYQALLTGEIENLEPIITLKDEVITKVNFWESKRAELVDVINRDLAPETPVKGVAGLLDIMQAEETRIGIPALNNLNRLLIDIITNIQEQNKKNQIFLNKAMKSLQDIKNGFSGKKEFTTYGANGQTRTNQRSG